MDDLQPRQKEILKMLTYNHQKFTPSVREIGMWIGLKSSSTVQTHLNKLEEKGYIYRHEGIARAITILKPYEQTGKPQA